MSDEIKEAYKSIQKPQKNEKLRELMIKKMEQARDIHKEWMEHIKMYPINATPAEVGGIKWHKDWVETYDQVIKLLKEGSK